MKTVIGVILVGALLMPAVSSCKPPTEIVVKSDSDVVEMKEMRPLIRKGDPRLSVDFELVRNKEGREVIVRITNQWREKVTIEHPGNRYALAFFVMNEHGNVIAPTGFAKVTMVKHEDIVMKPAETFEHTARGAVSDKYLFQFVSDTALFGYELERGRTYRVVAVYRPDGKDGEGICSSEKVIEYDAPSEELTEAHEDE